MNLKLTLKVLNLMICATLALYGTVPATDASAAVEARPVSLDEQMQPHEQTLEEAREQLLESPVRIRTNNLLDHMMGGNGLSEDSDERRVVYGLPLPDHDLNVLDHDLLIDGDDDEKRVVHGLPLPDRDLNVLDHDLLIDGDDDEKRVVHGLPLPDRDLNVLDNDLLIDEDNEERRVVHGLPRPRHDLNVLDLNAADEAHPDAFQTFRPVREERDDYLGGHRSHRVRRESSEENRQLVVDENTGHVADEAHPDTFRSMVLVRTEESTTDTELLIDENTGHVADQAYHQAYEIFKPKKKKRTRSQIRYALTH